MLQILEWLGHAIDVAIIFRGDRVVVLHQISVVRLHNLVQHVILSLLLGQTSH